MLTDKADTELLTQKVLAEMQSQLQAAQVELSEVGVERLS